MLKYIINEMSLQGLETLVIATEIRNKHPELNVFIQGYNGNIWTFAKLTEPVRIYSLKDFRRIFKHKPDLSGVDFKIITVPKRTLAHHKGFKLKITPNDNEKG